MPFPESVRKMEIENAYECEVCRTPVDDDLYLEVHSVTSLHLVKSKDPKNPRYIVKSPPAGHEHLKGKSLPLELYEDGILRGSDAACLCVACHQQIHRVALKVARKEGFKGKNPPPQIIEEVTKYFIKNGWKRNKDNRAAAFEHNVNPPQTDPEPETEEHQKSYGYLPE